MSQPHHNQHHHHHQPQEGVGVGVGVGGDAMVRWFRENPHEAQTLWRALQEWPLYRQMQDKCLRDAPACALGKKRQRGEDEREPDAESTAITTMLEVVRRGEDRARLQLLRSERGARDLSTAMQEEHARQKNASYASQHADRLESKLKLTRKIYIPVDVYPGINFFHIFIGPQGSTQKALEKRTKCKIALRGKGSVKSAARSVGLDEDLHVLIRGEHVEDVNRAVDIVEQLLVPVRDEENVHKQKQLRDLARINGTFRDDDVCYTCGVQGHWSWECPSRQHAVAAVNDVGGGHCGDSEHSTQDGAQQYHSSTETISEKFASARGEYRIASTSSHASSAATPTPSHPQQQHSLAPSAQKWTEEETVTRCTSGAIGRHDVHPAEPSARGFARPQQLEPPVGSRFTPHEGPRNLYQYDPRGVPCYGPSFQAGFTACKMRNAFDKQPNSQGIIPFKELEPGPVLGHGGFGIVQAAMWRGRRVAVKLLAPEYMDPQVVRCFEAEVSIMRAVHHPNVCHCFGACIEADHLSIVLELVERGSLWEILRREKDVLDVATRNQHDHGRRSGNGVLAPQLRSTDSSPGSEEPQLARRRGRDGQDRGFWSRPNQGQSPVMTRNCGTTHWMAPELLAGSTTYSEKTDVYSFGIVMWDVFTSKRPYVDMPEAVVSQRVLHDGLRPRILPSIPDYFARIMQSCWHRDPMLRPSFEDVLTVLLDHNRDGDRESRTHL